MQDQSQKQYIQIESLNTKYEETKNQLEMQIAQLKSDLGNALNSIESDKEAVEILRS